MSVFYTVYILGVVVYTVLAIFMIIDCLFKKSRVSWGLVIFLLIFSIIWPVGIVISIINIIRVRGIDNASHVER
jgi:hypothetical protein